MKPTSDIQAIPRDLVVPALVAVVAIAATSRLVKLFNGIKVSSVSYPLKVD